MKTKKRQKLCFNCEGEIDLDVIVCPFCAADLREEKPELQKERADPTVSLKNLTTQQSLYPSHYAETPKQEQQSQEEAPKMASVEEESKSIIGPTILMTLGAQLLFLGIFMLLFSRDGAIILKWDARLWFFYVLASIPFLIFGYRSIAKF